MKHILFWLVLSFLITSNVHADASELKGTLAVVNKSDNSISVISLESGDIIKTLPTGKGPHELVISKDEKWAVSTDFVGGDSRTVFDLENLSVARRINLAKYPGPHGIQFMSEHGEQNEVVFTSGKSQHIVMANIHTGKITKATPTSQLTTHMLAIDHSHQLIYTSNIRSNTISVIDLNTSQKRKDIPTKAMPEAINITRGGDQLWYGANQDGIVTVIDPNSEKELASFSGFKFPYRVLFNHDQSLALVPDFRAHQLRIFSTETFKEVGEVKLPENAGPQGIALHPAQDIAFLSLNLLNQVLVIDIKAQKVMASYGTGNNPDGLGFTMRSF